jgi:tetratricopeptide (TPR) repeat protein
LQLYPADPAAQKATRDAKTALDADKAPPSLNTKTEYDKAMAAGTAFEKQKMWPQALTAYGQALKYVPGDVKALAARKSSEFQVHMAEGQKLAAARNFSDAAKEYEQASKLFPDNKNARDALKRAQEGKP